MLSAKKRLNCLTSKNVLPNCSVFVRIDADAEQAAMGGFRHADGKAARTYSLHPATT